MTGSKRHNFPVFQKEMITLQSVSVPYKQLLRKGSKNCWARPRLGEHCSRLVRSRTHTHIFTIALPDWSGTTKPSFIKLQVSPEWGHKGDMECVPLC